MMNVLALIVLLVTAPLAGRSARADDFCASGWVCGKRTEAAYELVTQNGKEICTLGHVATSDDGGTRLKTTFFSNYSTNAVSMGFVVTIFQNEGGIEKPTMLRSIRLLSGDRKLDTRGWTPANENTHRPAVQELVTEETKEVLRTVLDVSSGDAYGIVAEKADGSRLRFEVRRRKDSLDGLKQLYVCFTNRQRQMQK
jgi:hypothetical protein